MDVKSTLLILVHESSEETQRLRLFSYRLADLFDQLLRSTEEPNSVVFTLKGSRLRLNPEHLKHVARYVSYLLADGSTKSALVLSMVWVVLLNPPTFRFPLFTYGGVFRRNVGSTYTSWKLTSSLIFIGIHPHFKVPVCRTIPFSCQQSRIRIRCY
jgi:hypothetical protein